MDIYSNTLNIVLPTKPTPYIINTPEALLYSHLKQNNITLITDNGLINSSIGR